jgi:hypothetical protein
MARRTQGNPDFRQEVSMNRIAVVLTGMVFLAACGDSQQTPKTTVFDDQVNALRKAEQVEGKVQENADALKKAVEAASDQPASDR